MLDSFLVAVWIVTG